MAHYLTGIDVGTYAVKFVCLETSFRKAKVRTAFEQVVEAGADPLDQRQGRALAAGLAQLPSEMTAYAALAGDRLAVRRLQFPIAEPRKVEAAIPFELEGEIVQPLEEVVFDYEFLPRVGRAGNGTHVLAASAAREEVARLLELFKSRGLEPRSLYAAPLVYRYLEPEAMVMGAGMASDLEREDTAVGALPDAMTTDGAQAEVVAAEMTMSPLSTGASGPTLRLLVDVGAARTNLVILEDGRPAFSRTVLRGAQELTQALATAFAATPEQAEEAKRTRGVVAHAGFHPQDNLDARMADVLKTALAPLLRDIRQTLASYFGLYHRAVERLSVVGGGAAQRGLAEALADELNLRLLPVELDRGGVQIEADDPPLDARFALAEAIAWAGLRGARQIDLRKGPFVYRANFSILRQKGLHLAALAAAVVLAVVLDGAMAYRKLHQESDKLEAELTSATTELFGRPDTDATSVARLLKRGFREEMPPIPPLTAYDLLNEISRRLPDKEKVKLDLQQLDIRPKKIFIKGTIDSVASVDEMVASLKEIDCFEEISKGAITEVSNGEKQFTLNVKSKCP